MFGMFDLTGSGKITHLQLEKAMQNLGIKDFTSTSTDKVDLQMFVAIAKEELDKVALRMPPLSQ